MGQENSRLFQLLMRVGIGFLLISSLYILLQLSSLFSYLYLVAKAVVTPILISLVIAYLLNPVVTLLSSRGVPRGVAVGVIYLVFILFTIVTLMNAIPAVINQSRDLTEHIPQLVHTYQLWLDEFNTHKYQLPVGLRLGIEQALEKFQARTTKTTVNFLDGAGNVLQEFVDLLIIPFIVFYMLKDMKMLQKGLLWFVPATRRKEVSKLLQAIDEALESYIGGQIIVCLVIGILAYIGYWVIDMPYAIILALVITITNIIPYIGPLIGAAPSVLVAVTISWKMTALVLVVNLIIQLVEGNVISPLIMGRRLHMHPLFLIIALLLGGEIGGLVGLIFAVPIAAILRVILQHTILHLVKH